MTPSYYWWTEQDETSDDNIFAKEKLGLLWISLLYATCCSCSVFVEARFIAWTIKIEKKVFIIVFIINYTKEREISTYNLIEIIVLLARHGSEMDEVDGKRF